MASFAADVMLTYGPGPIFAIDVGSLGDTELDNYGDWISGTRLLLERWIPFMKPTKVGLFHIALCVFRCSAFEMIRLEFRTDSVVTNFMKFLHCLIFK